MKPRGPMNIILFHLAVLGCTVAVPNGYYHQEYNYKTSASSFKNNELQHKTDDQGYYRKDGDLDGHVKPVVDANSEHSEYVNPNSQGGQYYGGANTDFSSTGNMRAQSGYNGYGSQALDAEGLARSDRVIGSRGYSSGSNTDFSSTGNARAQSGYNGYGSHALEAEDLARSGRVIGSTGYSSGYSSGYGSNSLGSHSQSSGTSSNLRLITSRLQQELESDLQEAVRQNNIYPQTRVDISQLERELKQNLTERLNNELTAKFGQQMVRGGMSYTITGGRLQSTANYDNEELSNLRSQLENQLMNNLRTQYASSSSSNSQYYNRQGSYGYTTTVRPVYYSIYPSLPSYTSTVRYPVDYNHANYQTVRYTPITNPQSITNIASRVQSQLDTRLNEVLDETRRKYFSTGSSYSLTNTDVLLERIRNELKSNLTYLLDEDIRNNYGTQIQRDGYLYSVGPSGQTSTDYNYSLRDLENLKQQVERNLIEKLNRDFETHRSSWSSHQSYNSQSNYGSNYQYSSTPRYYEVVATPRQSYVNPYSTSGSQQGGYIKTGSSSASNQYDYATGSQQSGYGVQSSGSIAQLQRQLQDDLSRQLRGALSTGHYSSHSSHGVYSPQNYQTTLQQLSDEVNRNLTKHLQEYSAMGSYAAYGNFDSAEMQRLKTQLQDSLMSQLQQGLQQSYQASSSYSSSSSSSSNSNYRPVRGFQDYQAGQYRSGIETVAGEDCAGDDPNAYSNVRTKRSFRFLSDNRDDQSQGGLNIGLNLGNKGPSLHIQLPTQLGQVLDNHASTHQIADTGYGKKTSNEQVYGGVGQRTEYRRYGVSQGHHQTEVGQQIDDNNDYENGRLQVSYPGQQVEDSDLTQQVVGGGQTAAYSRHEVSRGYHTTQVGQQIDDNDDYENGKLQVTNLGQQVDDSDLTQQVVGGGQTAAYSRHEVSRGYHTTQVGQQIDDNNDYENGRLQVSYPGQQVEDSDLTQEVVGGGQTAAYSRHEVSRGYHQTEVGQQIDDNDDYENGRLQVSNLGQQVDDSDLTQQVVGVGQTAEYSRHEVSRGYHQTEVGQQIDDNDDYENGKLQVSHPGQQVEDSDLTQQVVGGGQTAEYSRHEVSGRYHPTQVGQQIDDNDDYENGKLQVSHPGQQVEDSDLTQQVVGGGQTAAYSRHEVSRGYHQTEVGQQIDDNDDYENGRLQVSNLGQQVDDSDLTQQVVGVGQPAEYSRHEVSRGYHQTEVGQQIDDNDDYENGKLQVSHPGQQVEDSDLTQQVVGGGQTAQYSRHEVSGRYHPTQVGQQIVDNDDYENGKLQVTNLGQQVDDSDLTQQVVGVGQTAEYSRHEVSGGYHPTQVGQQIDDNDGYENGKLQVSHPGQQVEDSDLTQQVVGGGQTAQYSRHEVSGRYHPTQVGQQIVDNDDYENGKLQVTNLGQQVDDSDLTQQVVGVGQTAEYSRHEVSGGYHPTQVGQQIDDNDGYENGRLQVSHPGQQVDDSDLAQQVVGGGQTTEYSRLEVSGRYHPTQVGQQIVDNDDYENGKLQVTNLGQQVDDSDLTQQVVGVGQTAEYSRHEVSGGYHPTQVGQQIDDNDDYENGKLQVSHPGQEVDDSELTQQVVGVGQTAEYSRHEVSRGHDQTEVGQQIDDNDDYENGKLQVLHPGQQVDDSELTQQVVGVGQTAEYSRHEVSRGHDQTEVGQQIDDNDDYENGKLQVLHPGQQVDDSELTQQVVGVGQTAEYSRHEVSRGHDQTEVGQQIDDNDDYENGKLQVLHPGQQVDNSDLTQQVEDSGFGKLQISNPGQKVDDSELIPQVPNSGYQKLVNSNQGQQVDNSESTQQVEDIDYGKLPIPNQGQQDNNSYLTQKVEDFGYGKLQNPNQVQKVDDSYLTQQVEDSGYGKLQNPNQVQKVDDSYLTQQVEDSGYGKLQTPNQGQQVDVSNSIPQVQDSSKLQVSDQHRHFDDSDLTQQVEDLGNGKHQVSNPSQQVTDSDSTQQVEDAGYGNLPQSSESRLVTPGEHTGSYGLTQEQVSPQIGLVNVQTGSQISHKEICSKYINTSLMNVPWQLSNQFRDEIVNQYQKIPHGSTISQRDRLYQNILAELPENVIYHCFKILDIKMDQQTEDREVEELDSYFRYLINQEINDIIKRNNENNDQKLNQTPEKLEVTTVNESGSENEYVKIDRWCSKFIDTSLMDAPWTLSSQLEEEITREYHLLADGTTESQKDILYQKVLAKLPKNIMYTCFQVSGMKMNGREEVVTGLENYFRTLIKQNIDNVVQNNKQNLLQQSEKEDATENENHLNQEVDDNLKQGIVGQLEGNDNSPKFKYNPNPLGTLFPEQPTQKSITGENQYPQTHVINENDSPSKVTELLTSNQIIETNPKRGENMTPSQITNSVPQSVTPSSSQDSVQPKQSQGNAFEVTDQGQFFHRPQTLPEAEHTANSLIDALRDSQTNRHIQQTNDDSTGYGYYGRQNYNSYRHRSRVYEDSRQLDGPHGSRYSHYPKYNRPGYENRPIDYNHRLYTGTYGSNQFPTHNMYGYPHQPTRYNKLNKPLSYGQEEIVEHNVETTSDIKPVRTGQANFVNNVKPVYSGVKGRSRYSSSSSSSYQPGLSQVQLEPVAIQKIVSQDVAAVPTVPAIHETTPLSTENENLPWWKRVGHKIKQGATDLKNKIVGI